MKVTLRQITWNYRHKINIIYKEQVCGEILLYLSKMKGILECRE